MAREPFLINPPAAGHRKAVLIGLRRAKRSASASRKRTKHNPFGEEVILVGANPRSRHKRRRVHRRGSIMTNPRRRTRRHRRGYALNPYRHHRRHRRYRSNPVRRYHRRHRRYRSNPVESMSLHKPMSILMPIGIGLGAKLITERAPGLLGITDANMSIAVQAGVAVGVPMLLKKALGKENATIFAIVSGVVVLQKILETYVFKTALSGFGALVNTSAYPSVTMASSPVAVRRRAMFGNVESDFEPSEYNQQY